MDLLYNHKYTWQHRWMGVEERGVRLPPELWSSCSVLAVVAIENVEDRYTEDVEGRFIEKSTDAYRWDFPNVSTNVSETVSLLVWVRMKYLVEHIERFGSAVWQYT
jgi:hypothetical protein